MRSEIEVFEYISEELIEIYKMFEEKADETDTPGDSFMGGGILSIICC